MKKAIYILFVLYNLGLWSQTEQIDISPNKYENYRVYEGGNCEVSIDYETPTSELLSKLENDWEFIETGKAYWIGYTDLMYSIASRKNIAIEPLINFIKTTNSYDAKIGALYCLHLIGINSTISGRFYEKFTNKKARNALLNLLEINELQETIVSLLIRDPWLSDIPKLFDVLKNNDTDCWAIVNLIFRYNLKNIPLQQEMPNQFNNKEINISDYSVNVFDRSSNSEKQLQEILKSIKKNASENILIEKSLFDTNLLGKFRYNLCNNGKIKMEKFLSDITRISYVDYGNRIQYYFENNKLYICSSMTAKQRLLHFWKNYKNKKKYISDKSIYRKN